MSQIPESLRLPEKVRMPTTAAVIRAVLKARAKRIELDLWLPFPQRSCCFSFGPKRRPLPIGALFLLWCGGPPFVQQCPQCDGKAYIVSFGGLLSIGGATLVCASCHAPIEYRIGGLSAVANMLKASPLAGTPFQFTGMVYGGAVISEGKELMELLGLDLPPDPGEAPSVTLEDGTPIKMSFHGHEEPLRR